MFLGSAVGIKQRLAVGVESARLTMEPRLNLARLLAVLGGVQMIVPLRPCSALDFTSLAILLVRDFASIGAVLEGYTVSFQFGLVLAEDLTFGAVVFPPTVFHAFQMVSPHGVRTFQSKITEIASMRFGDTGNAVSFIAISFFFQSGFNFLLAFFLLVLGGSATHLVHLAFVFAVFAVRPAF